MTMQNNTYTRAMVRMVERVIKYAYEKRHSAKGVVVGIHLNPSDDPNGLRVEELAISADNMGAYIYNQRDIASGAMLFAIERCLLTLVDGIRRPAKSITNMLEAIFRDLEFAREVAKDLRDIQYHPIHIEQGEGANKIRFTRRWVDRGIVCVEFETNQGFNLPGADGAYADYFRYESHPVVSPVNYDAPLTSHHVLVADIEAYMIMEDVSGVIDPQLVGALVKEHWDSIFDDQRNWQTWNDEYKNADAK